jgi:uncharacterized protein DUF4154
MSKRRVEIIKKQAPLWVCLIYLFTIPLSMAFDREAEVKAAYLYRLPLFVEWPKEKIISSAVFTICITENLAFYHSVLKSISEKKINNKVLNIQLVNQDYDIDKCNVLFISDKTKNIDWYMGYVSNKPILTVGESIGFYRKGGIIYLHKKNNRMKFFINNSAVAKSKLKVRAQLLKLSIEPVKGEQ